MNLVHSLSSLGELFQSEDRLPLEQSLPQHVETTPAVSSRDMTDIGIIELHVLEPGEIPVWTFKTKELHNPSSSFKFKFRTSVIKC